MHSIAALDRVLLGSAYSPDVFETIGAIAAGQLWPGLRDPDDVATYLRGVTGESEVLVAATLLILLHRDPASLDEVPWRPLAAEILRKRLEHLRPHASKPAEKGSHAVFTACSGVVGSVEADFKAQIAGLSDLKQVRTLRNAVLRRLNGGAGAIVFRPFAPRATLDAPLAALLDAAETMSSDNVDEDASYSALDEALVACQAAVEATDTYFARETVGALAESISTIATRRIELSRPPARLIATVDARPLPIREAGVTCDVALHVENASDVGATQIAVSISADGEQIMPPSVPIRVEALRPRTAVPLSVPLTVLRPAPEVSLRVDLTWRNPDHSSGSATSDATVTAQAGDIDWDAAIGLRPFAPYPVEDAESLIGRRQLLHQLERQFATIPLANMYITGQRRVGKTSLVRVLTQQLKAKNKHLVVASVEIGEVRHEGGKETISRLGSTLSRKLIRASGAAGVSELPAFEGSLAPLNELVDELRELDDRLTFLLIVDEFDELPDEMFRRGGAGDAMFLPMRSLAQKPYVGWILVGGERMPFIRDEQATRLNTFSATKVDYLPFIEHDAPSELGAGNFAALVRQPLPPGFVVAEEAVGRIHALTLGNPHFAKALCAEVYADAVRRKDAMIQQQDVDRAVAVLATQSDMELFAHFWEDGIFTNDGEERRRAELDRRHVLTAVAECGRAGRATCDQVDATAEGLGLTRATAKRTRNEFLRRAVLTDNSGDVFPTVPLFGAWLEEEGAYQLTPKGIAERAEEAFSAADTAAKIKPSEVTRILTQWRGFKFRGESISRDDVTQWLSQFSNAVEQRLMFRLLERFRAISEAELLEGLRRPNRLISHEGRIQLDEGQRALAHMIVAGVGDSGTSGQAIAYKYRQANNVRLRNVVAVEEIAERLSQDSAVRAVVLVDDFIGSGKTLAKALKELTELDAPHVQFFAFVVSGIREAMSKLERGSEASALRLRVEAAHAVTSSQRPFTPESTVFRNDDDQARAEQIVRQYGTQLVGSMPLGFEQQAALITFPDNCPNNVPPIFWSDANGWRPLFPRTAR